MQVLLLLPSPTFCVTEQSRVVDICIHPSCYTNAMVKKKRTPKLVLPYAWWSECKCWSNNSTKRCESSSPCLCVITIDAFPSTEFFDRIIHDEIEHPKRIRRTKKPRWILKCVARVQLQRYCISFLTHCRRYRWIYAGAFFSIYIEICITHLHPSLSHSAWQDRAKCLTDLCLHILFWCNISRTVHVHAYSWDITNRHYCVTDKTIYTICTTQFEFNWRWSNGEVVLWY